MIVRVFRNVVNKNEVTIVFKDSSIIFESLMEQANLGYIKIDTNYFECTADYSVFNAYFDELSTYPYLITEIMYVKSVLAIIMNRK